MSLKKLISHIIFIGFLLVATPAGAINKHIDSSVNTVNQISLLSNRVSTLSSKQFILNDKWYQPIWNLGPKVRRVFTCIIYRESRSTWETPKVSDGTYDQYGIFQINWGAGIWQKYVEPNLHITVQKANAYQQALGVALIFRADGYFPWKYDGCPQQFGYFYP